MGFRTISNALTSLDDHRGLPVGHLRLNMLRDAARLVVGPLMRAYHEAFPQMQLDMTVDDKMVDIIQGGFDAGIRYGDRVPLDMVGIALTKPTKWVVVGAPALIAKVGLPDSPQDLLRRPCVEMRVGDDSRFPWELGNGDNLVRLDVHGPICTNETEQAVDAATRGLGFAYCLERRVTHNVARGDLVIALPDWASDGPPFTIYHSSRRQPPPGLRELIDMIRVAEGLKSLIDHGGQKVKGRLRSV
jgi:DNA-binding transcriptional LysR family regulator